MIHLSSDYVGYQTIRDDDALLPRMYAEKDKNWFDL